MNIGLAQMQQVKREESIERVTWAVQFIQDTEGVHSRITAVKIASICGLSRAALYKSHLRPIWDKSFSEELLKRKTNQEAELKEQAVKKLHEQIALLEVKLKKSETRNEQLLQELSDQKTRAKVYRQDYQELKERHHKLLHYNLRILRKLHLHGMDISEFNNMNEDESS